jgi:hypothetical protein
LRKRKSYNRRRAAVLGALAAGVLCLVGLPASAGAAPLYENWYWGCTYSWGYPCTAKEQVVWNQYSLEPDEALQWYGPGYPTKNGYPPAKRDERQRDMCEGVMWPNHTMRTAWDCGWGPVLAQYGTEQIGLPAIGGAEYYNIALYQIVNFRV